MKLKRSILLILLALCAAALFGLGRAELRSHKKSASTSRNAEQDGEPGLSLAGTIGPTITVPVIARHLYLTVPINAAVKRGDVIGTEESATNLGEVEGARRELEDACSGERQAIETLRQLEERLAAVQSRTSILDREEVQAGFAESDAEREFERDDRLYRSGRLSRFDYDAAGAAHASAETTADSVRSNISEASIDTDELDATALEAKAELREATERRAAAQAVFDKMRGGVEARPVVSPADGVIVTSALPEGASFGIASDGPLFAHAMVPEADLMQLRIGQEASIVLDAQPSAVLHAQLTAIAEAPEDSPDGSFYELTLLVENQGGPWLTGVAMHARLARPTAALVRP
jgi:multidrug resistance efflux pump